MKKFAAFMVVAMAVVFAFGTAFAAAPEKVTIDKFKKTKSAVTFDHKKHAAAVKDDCKACHHSDEKGKEQGCSTAKCHGEKADGKKIEAKEAFHKQCKDCHKKMKKGPLKCDECHPKK